jgi:hypothetical protein
MMLEVEVEGNRTLINLDQVIEITEKDNLKCDIYTSTGVISTGNLYSDFTRILEKNITDGS